MLLSRKRGCRCGWEEEFSKLRNSVRGQGFPHGEVLSEREEFHQERALEEDAGLDVDSSLGAELAEECISVNWRPS